MDIVTSPVSTMLKGVTKAPGDIVEAPITVTNSGSLELRHAIQRLADNPDSMNLRDILRLRIGLKNGASCKFPYYDTAGTPTTLVTDTPLYEGPGFPASAPRPGATWPERADPWPYPALDTRDSLVDNNVYSWVERAPRETESFALSLFRGRSEG